MNFIETMRESANELKNVKVLTGGALLAALHVILDFMRIVVSATLEISFAFLSIAVAGMLYGPVVAAIIGAGADILAYFVKPSGFFFPGFTLNMAVTGIIFGMFFYKKQITLQKVMLAVLVESIIISLILTPIWLKMMYGSELFAVARIIKTATLYPINVALCYIACKNLSVVRSKITNN